MVRDMNDKRMQIDGEMTIKTDGMDENKTNYNRKSMRMGNMNEAETLEQVYLAIDERMCKAICFHEQLADYFCFLGLQGYKRMLEYQYMMECAEKRKLHRRYIDHHHKILPARQVQTPVFVPKDWNRYTTQDIDDNVMPRFVRAAMKQYHEWEEETKELYQEQCDILMQANMVSDCEYVKELIVDVEKELKRIARIMESLNGTGYDVTMIHGMQDKLHQKYKQKYNDRFTTKNNMRVYPEEWEPYGEQRRIRRRIGY